MLWSAFLHGGTILWSTCRSLWRRNARSWLFLISSKNRITWLRYIGEGIAYLIIIWYGMFGIWGDRCGQIRSGFVGRFWESTLTFRIGMSIKLTRLCWVLLNRVKRVNGKFNLFRRIFGRGLMRVSSCSLRRSQECKKMKSFKRKRRKQSGIRDMHPSKIILGFQWFIEREGRLISTSVLFNVYFYWN